MFPPKPSFGASSIERRHNVPSVRKDPPCVLLYLSPGQDSDVLPVFPLRFKVDSFLACLLKLSRVSPPCC